MIKPLTLTACQDNCTVILSRNTVDLFTLFYSTNYLPGWHRYNKGQEIKLYKAGDFVQFANSRSDVFSDINGHWQFILTGFISASGSVQSLLNFSNECTPYCFWKLFRDCKTLVHPPELTATKLALYCYAEMFSYCESLKYAPELPAKKMETHCYYNMFNECTKIKEAPELPAKALAISCYEGMFGDCYSLKLPPKLPARSLAPYCYQQMFFQIFLFFLRY